MGITEKLNRSFQNKRHGMLASDVVLIHDNAHPHIAARTEALVEHLNWELFDHSPYSHELRVTTTCLPTLRTD
jgi:hypothetical protein